MNVRTKLPGGGDEGEPRSILDELVRSGAQEMLAKALEAEVADFLAQYKDVVDEQGHRQVVRNGRLPQREIMTGAGPLEVSQPRVRDRRGANDEDAVTFTSKILPRYLRRSKTMDELLPWLYLRGISTGGFQPSNKPQTGKF